MPNPFEKRATEYVRDDDQFLSMISPEPLVAFFEKPGIDGQLYDRLVRVIGTPGSGKTTIATLLEYRLVETILADPDKPGNRPLASALAKCRMTVKGRPTTAAVRLPLEAEYREFWELPYDEALKTKLVLALIQARTVLGLVRNVTGFRRTADEVEFVLRTDADAAGARIGGPRTADIVARAREVERAVYSVGTRLVPLPAKDLPEDAVLPYRPFDVIEAIRVPGRQSELVLKPMVILDDAHTLEPAQFAALARDLARREIRVSRWFMMRLDALSSADALFSGETVGPEVKPGRDYLEIRLQQASGRKAQRLNFRRMAKDMSNRYLRQYDAFSSRDYRDFETLLSTEPDTLSEQTQQRVMREVAAAASKFKISPSRRAGFEREISAYAAGSTHDVGADVQAGMLKVMISRYAKRVPQESLFSDPDPRLPISADAGVADAARSLRRERGDMARHVRRYAAFFAVIDRSCASAVEVTQARLVEMHGVDGLRRGFQAVAFLAKQLSLDWNADAVVTATERLRVEATIAAAGREPWGRDLEAYRWHLAVSRKLAPRTTRMYVAAAAALMRASGVKRAHELTPRDLARHLRRSRGRRNNLLSFLSWVTAHLAKALTPAARGERPPASTRRPR